MLRTFALAFLLIVTALPVTAGFKEGVAAYKRGDYRTAFHEFKPLAEKGNARAQFNLGILYEKGWSIPKNYREAARWYRKASAQGHDKAQHNLGSLYYLGQGGPKNYKLAYTWFRKAAQQGNRLGQAKLGVMYYKGWSVPKNHKLAYMWLSLAAARGYKIAAKLLELIEKDMTGADVSKAQAMAAKWRPKKSKRR